MTHRLHAQMTGRVVRPSLIIGKFGRGKNSEGKMMSTVLDMLQCLWVI